jgi:hypothetical protein
MAHGEKEAEKLLDDGLAATGSSKSELREFPVNERRKSPWREPLDAEDRIAERLDMKKAANVSLSLHWMKDDRCKLPTLLVKLIECMKMLADRFSP